MRIIAGEIPDIPREARGPIMRELRAVRKYFPHWLRTLRVLFITNPEGEEAYAIITTCPEYFSATLRIFPGWLDKDPIARHHTFLHEVGHLHHAHAFHTAREMIDKMASGNEKELAISLLKRSFEESAEAFALMVERLEER